MSTNAELARIFTQIADILDITGANAFRVNAHRKVARTLEELEPLGPSYVSVTYGAGGSTRERTHDLVVQILRDTTMTPMAHLTCACHTRAELVDIVTRRRGGQHAGNADAREPTSAE